MPKEYTLIGGNGTMVSPLEVNESGTYEAGDSRAFNPVKVNVPSGSSTLSGLTDVDISNPADGQTLVYNATTGKWVNGAGGGGGALVVRGLTVGEEVTLDHTYAEIVSAAPLVYYASEPAPNRVVFKPLNAFGEVDELYIVQFGNETPFSTDSEDGYPVSHGIN